MHPQIMDQEPVLIDRENLAGVPARSAEFQNITSGDTASLPNAAQFLAGSGLPSKLSEADILQGPLQLSDRFVTYGWDEFITSLLGTPTKVGTSAGAHRIKIEAAVVTIDLVDSTGYLEQLERNGQSTSLALDRIFTPLASALRAGGGHFATVIGDGMSAVFTRQPAAWDALNAAMGLQERWKRDLQVGLLIPSMRVGLAYGPVELQALGPDSQARVIGSAVNRAFQCAAGKCPAERLPDLEPGFSIYLDPSFRREIALQNLISTPA